MASANLPAMSNQTSSGWSDGGAGDRAWQGDVLSSIRWGPQPTLARVTEGMVVVVEDNVRAGGVGDAVARDLSDAGIDRPVRTYGVPGRFLDHGSRAEVLAEAGLTAADVAREVVGQVARLDESVASGDATEDQLRK